MLLPRYGTRQGHRMLSDDEVGYLLRWGLQDWVANAEPSPQTWSHVLVRVHEMDESQAHPHAARGFPATTLVQSVVVCAILMLGSLRIEQRSMPLVSQNLSHMTTLNGDEALPQMPTQDAQYEHWLLLRERGLVSVSTQDAAATAGQINAAPLLAYRVAPVTEWKLELLKQ